MNTDGVTTDSSCESHVTTDEESTDNSQLDSDEELADLSCEEHVDTDNDSITTSSSVEDLPTATIPTQLKHSLSFNSSDSFSEESCDEDFPDEFFIFPSDCGNIGLILGPDDWEKIETDNSSQENLTSDDGGTSSTNVESGQCYDVDFDVDSMASSHSSCHSPVPKEVVSCLSCSSDGDPVTVTTTSGCDDRLEESHQRTGEMNCGNHCNVHRWTLEYGDSDNQTSSNGCTSSVSYGDEPTNSSLYDCDLISDEDSFDFDQGLYKHLFNYIIPSSFNP